MFSYGTSRSDTLALLLPMLSSTVARSARGSSARIWCVCVCVCVCVGVCARARARVCECDVNGNVCLCVRACALQDLCTLECTLKCVLACLCLVIP